MKLKLKAKNNIPIRESFENLLDVIWVILNKEINTDYIQERLLENHDRSSYWQYQYNETPSTFEESTRVNLIPSRNNYWINIDEKSEDNIIFRINFRYFKEKAEVYNNFISEIFDNIEKLS